MKNILDKNDCIRTLKPLDKLIIHPLTNQSGISQKKIDVETCAILPQLIEDSTIWFSRYKSGLKKNIDDNRIINPATNFGLVINSNNFLDIIFGINTINKLLEWIQNYDLEDRKTINLVLNLFWKNYYYIIDKDLDFFIRFNKVLIKIMFNKDVDIMIVSNIINRLLRKNYGKKIKYLSKIKKYLMKYI